MDTSTRWKLGFAILVLLLGAYFLIPTYRVYFGMEEGELDALPASERNSLLDGALSLGLDLQGGMDLLLELDTENIPQVEGQSSEPGEVMERALSVLRNRVDEFGVAEPIVQKLGADRISVQLPGFTNPDRARYIIQRVARLEFRLLKEQSELDHILRRVDRLLALKARGFAEADTSVVDSLALDNPLLSRYIPLSESDVAFPEDDVTYLEGLMAEAKIDSLVRNAALVWDKETITLTDGRQARRLYVVNRKVELTGEGIKRAFVGYDPTTGAPEVNLNFSTRAAATFARVTGNNVGRRLAILLDDRVSSAPIIQGRISGGRATISGGQMDDIEANDLKVVLEAGALPAPLKIIEERTVGPSLGRDSIRQGVRAGLVGAGCVILFMLIYYRASGIVAVLALSLNVFLLLAALAKLGATLTLPGIAGIVLTIGFAVDANVLIFERIREEMRREKTVRASVNAGFERAFSAIFDANITTLIAAFVLLRFGTGPIKGFAVTLAIGIVANLFTAYFVSRLIFTLVTNRARPAKLSI